MSKAIDNHLLSLIKDRSLLVERSETLGGVTHYSKSYHDLVGGNYMFALEYVLQTLIRDMDEDDITPPLANVYIHTAINNTRIDDVEKLKKYAFVPKVIKSM